MESFLLIIILIISFFLQFLSPASSQGHRYFIDCGSESNVTVGGRDFLGDTGSAFLNSTSDLAVNDSSVSSNSNSLYKTARIFRNTSAYEFPVAGNQTHVVRLHFFPFSSPSDNLSSAVFDASVSGFALLRGFSAGNGSAIIKEYFLKPKGSTLVISFVPSQSSFAFVNAIEVFQAPVGIINETVRVVGSENYPDLSGTVQEKLFRINVGGPQITDDPLWRTWIPDKEFLVLPNAAMAVNTSSPIRYGEGMIPEIAPQPVYATAQQMKPDPLAFAQLFNITWRFLVTNGSKYLVRLHFCNIVNDTNRLQFPVYIGSSRAGDELNLNSLVAYYEDFVAEPDSRSLLNVSVGPSQKRDSLLNGLEIMMIHDAAVNTSKGSNKPPIGLLVGSVLGGFALISLLAVALLLVFRHRKKTAGKLKQKVGPQGTMWLPMSIHEGSSNTTEGEEIIPSVLPNLGLKISFHDILVATDNFHVNSLIGTGGFGNVYKGVLKDGTKVAVKRAKPESGQGMSEFVAEITVLSKIRHRHLVSLIGYCEEQSEMILVYEFMEKGPLKNHLYGSDLPSLSWKQRLQICIDSARGLHYLHTGSSQGIIHRDIKCANILLDDSYVAKVADFGLSKAVASLDQTHVSTFVKGTFGYLDPEYYKRHQITDKSDVFSFGVVLLEVLCARPAVDNSLPREQVNLSEWAMGKIKRGMLEQIMDSRLAGQVDPNSLRKFVETAEKCLAERGSDRPVMADVLWNLQYALQLQEIAVRREAYEDSASNVKGSPLPIVRRVPSNCVESKNDSQSIKSDSTSEVTASGVFSQLFASGEGR